MYDNILNSLGIGQKEAYSYKILLDLSVKGRMTFELSWSGADKYKKKP